MWCSRESGTVSGNLSSLQRINRGGIGEDIFFVPLPGIELMPLSDVEGMDLAGLLLKQSINTVKYRDCLLLRRIWKHVVFMVKLLLRNCILDQGEENFDNHNPHQGGMV